MEAIIPEPALTEKVQQFNKQEYSRFVESDPMRNFLHYPAVLKLLGDVKGKDILDVGCGDGLFDRIMAEKTGAKVFAYDRAPHLISIAQKLETETPHNISFQIADPETFSSDTKFDSATSVLVICYSPNEEYLGHFFNSTHRVLKEGGKFISVTINPLFKDFGKQIGNRIFNKLPNGEIEVSFLNPENGSVMLQSHLNQFSREAYEEKARAAGFQNVLWQNLTPTEEGIAKLGKDFWGDIENQQPYTVFIAS